MIKQECIGIPDMILLIMIFFVSKKIKIKSEIVLRPGEAYFLKEFFNDFCFFFGGPDGFDCSSVCPINFKKELFAEEMTCFTMDLKTDQTLILALSLSSSFFNVAFH